MSVEHHAFTIPGEQQHLLPDAAERILPKPFMVR